MSLVRKEDLSKLHLQQLFKIRDAFAQARHVGIITEGIQELEQQVHDEISVRAHQSGLHTEKGMIYIGDDE